MKESPVFGLRFSLADDESYITGLTILGPSIAVLGNTSADLAPKRIAYFATLSGFVQPPVKILAEMALVPDSAEIAIRGQDFNLLSS